MSIVTISRGSYSRGKEIAEIVSERLGYKCLSRDILLDTSDKYHIPEIKLIRAIHDAPSILDRFVYNKDKYINFVQSTLLNHLKADNVVYHGLAGHFFVKDIPHVLKVRIISDMEDRIMCEMERENISYEEAKSVLKKDDEQRRKWSLNLYGIDTSDPSLYDLVIHIGKITMNDAADLVCHTLEKEQFKTTAQSQKMIEDLALAAEVRTMVFNITPNIGVFAYNGNIHIQAKARELQEEKLIEELKSSAGSVEGVKNVTVEIQPVAFYAD
jgi:cytidylate kinase